ncbi:MAG: RNA polymerase-binding transcription factor DksA [Syntrophus sp. SKADARSKE-3]|nr:RNA polymerase-binding transcription factor DksA [Syntrophus sp. SKADARSKE-3]
MITIDRSLLKHQNKRIGKSVKPEKLMFFRERLQQKIAELLNDQTKTLSVMLNSGERTADSNDQASMEAERNYELRIRDRERRLILKMTEAIKRIDNGTFGICVDCGEEISEKRLMARLVTTQCLDCKNKQEKLEKAQRMKDVRFVHYGFQGSPQSHEDDD